MSEFKVTSPPPEMATFLGQQPWALWFQEKHFPRSPLHSGQEFPAAPRLSSWVSDLPGPLTPCVTVGKALPLLVALLHLPAKAFRSWTGRTLPLRGSEGRREGGGRFLDNLPLQGNPIPRGPTVVRPVLV